MEVLFLGFCWLWCSYTKISWQNGTNGVNQLHRLSRRWVPGIPRPASPIEYCPHGWQIPATQLWAPIPGTHHTEETLEVRKIRDERGGGGVEAWKQLLHRPLHKRSTKNLNYSTTSVTQCLKLGLKRGIVSHLWKLTYRYWSVNA